MTELHRIGIAPVQARGSLTGFLLLQNWPRDTVEWSKLLVLAVQVAAIPGFLPASTVFLVQDELPELVYPGAVGVIVSAGHAVGEDALAPGDLAERGMPPALVVLHPPQSIQDHGAAAGCVFLPGLPYLGLDHRAVWANADAEGRVSRLITRGDVDPAEDPDTAALASLLAA
ncbi:hypothetical protein [Granulicoccus phenolivorans]|uniref:hypothetical protein n=1 Tax=Granulicoccus phenolivorans TaxID=266854 RepID=UPI0003FD0670|nr:hypothetical protein [Granulicoccus phenolivorans]